MDVFLISGNPLCSDYGTKMVNRLDFISDKLEEHGYSVMWRWWNSDVDGDFDKEEFLGHVRDSDLLVLVGDISEPLDFFAMASSVLVAYDNDIPVHTVGMVDDSNDDRYSDYVKENDSVYALIRRLDG